MPRLVTRAKKSDKSFASLQQMQMSETRLFDVIEDGPTMHSKSEVALPKSGGIDVRFREVAESKPLSKNVATDFPFIETREGYISLKHVRWVSKEPNTGCYRLCSRYDGCSKRDTHMICPGDKDHWFLSELLNGRK